MFVITESKKIETMNMKRVNMWNFAKWTRRQHVWIKEVLLDLVNSSPANLSPSQVVHKSTYPQG